MRNHETDIFTKQELSVMIGEKIKFFRLKSSISQSELGRRCGKDKQHIELIENGKISPNIYTLYLLSDALAIELHELFVLTKKEGRDHD